MRDGLPGREMVVPLKGVDRRLAPMAHRRLPAVPGKPPIVKTCGLDYTLVRASWFAQNFSEGYLRDPVRYIPITFDQFHASMTEIGGKFIADVFTGICRETLDGRNEYLTDGVQQALGRKPRDFADFCRAAASSGTWSEAA